MNRHAPRRHLSNTAERDVALAVREPQFSYFHFVPYENCQFPSLGHRTAGRTRGHDKPVGIGGLKLVTTGGAPRTSKKAELGSGIRAEISID